MKNSIGIVLCAAAFLLPGCVQPAQQTESPALEASILPPASSTQPPTLIPSPTAAPTATPLPELGPWSPAQVKQAVSLSSIGSGILADAAWSPDGSMIAVASLTTIRLYDAHTFQLIRSIAAGATTIAFSPDGRLLASDGRSAVYLWDVASGALASKIKTDADFDVLAFMPDGKRIITGADLQIGEDIWDVATGQRLQHFKQHDPVMGTDQIVHLAVSPDGKQFVVGYRVTGVMGVDADTGEQLFSFGWGETGLAYSPDGSRLANPNRDELFLFNTHGEQTSSVSLEGSDPGAFLRNVAYSPLGDVVAASETAPSGKGGSSRIIMWDPGAGAIVRTIETDGGRINALRFSPDGGMLISLSADQVPHLWNAATGEPVGRLDAFNVGMFSLAFSTDSRYLFTGERLGAVRMWDVSTGSLLRSFSENVMSGPFDIDVIESLAVSPDGNLLAAAHSGKVTLWSLEDQTPGMDIQIRDISPVFQKVAFSPDGSTLIWSGDSAGSAVVDVVSRKITMDLPSREAMADMTLTTGEEFATAVGQAVSFWSWRTGSALGVLRRSDISKDESIRTLAYSPAAKLAAMSDYKRVQIWDAAHDTWTMTHQLDAPDSVEAMVFDSSGGLLAIGAQDGSLTIVDAASGETLATFDADRAESMAFSPDGRLLAVTSLHGEVQLWGIPRAP